MNSKVLVGCCLALVATACKEAADDPEGGNRTTLRLNAEDDGDLQNCDSTGQCTSLPNPNGCATLVITIDNTNGQTCESCLGADGNEVYRDCEGRSVACDVITVPEPDCVVCAYVNGAIIYSTCVPPEDDIVCEWVRTGGLEPMPGTDGGAPDSSDSASGSSGPDANSGQPTDPDREEPPTDPNEPTDPSVPPPPNEPSRSCEICYDRNGDIVKYECVDECLSVACTAIGCGPGYEARYVSGECCPVCVPVEHECNSDLDCERGVCIAGKCQFDECQLVDCAMPLCEEGFHLEYGSSCCPVCVPDEQHTCYSSNDCLSGQHCSVDDGDCRSDCPPGMFCTDVCQGVCVGDDTAIEECEPEACGPALGMPNMECADGHHWSGPTGRCLRNSDGSCGWEVLECPPPPQP